MKIYKNLSVLVLSIALTAIVLPSAFGQTTGQTTDLHIALQRGYRTGYSDGYMAGYRDTIDGIGKSYTRHDEYGKADRAFNRDYGSVEDYRDGYQQGFETGYETGFSRRSFESAPPTELKKRGAASNSSQPTTQTPENNVATSNMIVTRTTGDNNQLPATVQNNNSNYQDSTASYRNTNAVIIIPRDTELMLELQEDLSTERSRTGEKFSAKVISPAELAGATIEGRVQKIVPPGHFKRRSELSLSFDRIIVNSERWSNFSAMMTEVLPVKGDNIKKIDSEGTAIGKSSYKSDAVKIGASTGTGLVIGAIAGGPVGAAVGAGVGAAFGVGAVIIDRGKHVKLTRNQQLRVKTAYEVQIR